MILDNLTAHKSKRVLELVEGRGCRVLFLPAYSPDLSPIEEAFSKVKALLKKDAPRTRKALVEGIGGALSVITARDAAGWGSPIVAIGQALKHHENRCIVHTPP